jgi:hypothetical protein
MWVHDLHSCRIKPWIFYQRCEFMACTRALFSHEFFAKHVSSWPLHGAFSRHERHYALSLVIMPAYSHDQKCCLVIKISWSYALMALDFHDYEYANGHKIMKISLFMSKPSPFRFSFLPILFLSFLCCLMRCAITPIGTLFPPWLWNNLLHYFLTLLFTLVLFYIHPMVEPLFKLTFTRVLRLRSWIYVCAFVNICVCIH